MLKKGFSLIELLISLALLTLLMLISFQFFVIVSNRICKISERASFCAELCSAFDTIARYVHSASFDASTWKQTKRGYIWLDAHKKRDLGCFFEKKSLYIVTGIYSEARWKKRRKNLIAKGLTRFIFSPQIQAGVVRSVHCIIEGECDEKLYTFERTIILRNRHIL